MLDVHPPHGAIRAGKDFFIHIATLTIGVLIAVALQPVVEPLHHLHQMQEMTSKLRPESLDNIPLGLRRGFYST